MVVSNERLYFSLTCRTIIDHFVLAAEKLAYLGEEFVRCKCHDLVIAQGDLVDELRSVEYISLKCAEAA